MSYSPFMLNNAPSAEAPWTNCKLDLVLWRFRVDKNLWSLVKFDKHRVLPWMINPLSISTFSTQVNFKIIVHALDLLSHTPWPSVSNSVLGFNAYLKQTWLPLKQTRLGRKYWVCCKNSELLSTISPDNGSGPVQYLVRTRGTGRSPARIQSWGSTVSQVEKRVWKWISNQMLSSSPFLHMLIICLVIWITEFCFSSLVGLYKVWRAAGLAWTTQSPGL